MAGTIVVLSGGGFDLMNPREVRDRMDRLATDSGLAFTLLPFQSTPHIHQAFWRWVCEVLKAVTGPLVLVGHSNGGAAAVSLARCLEVKGKAVDLLVTCDSVATIDDLGNPNTVPANVRLNLNSYVIKTPFWILLPFPYGKRNARADGSQTGILNIGMAYNLPGMLAHRNAFYDLEGGDGGYPRLLLSAIQVALAGAKNGELEALALAALRTLATTAHVPIMMDSASGRTVLT